MAATTLDNGESARLLLRLPQRIGRGGQRENDVAHAHSDKYHEDVVVKVFDGEVHIKLGDVTTGGHSFHIALNRAEAVALAADLTLAARSMPE